MILPTRGVEGQTSDDHGNGIATASELTLGTFIKGRIDSHDDQDVFRLDLSGAWGTTDVWIYTTGDLDTVGGLFDRTANRIAVNDDSAIVDSFANFHLRASLTPGVYYVLVVSFRNQYIGDYTLHAEAVTPPGRTVNTATRLSLYSPTPGAIDTADDVNFFRMEFSKRTDAVVYALATNYAAIDAVVLESGGAEISVNVYPQYAEILGKKHRRGFLIRDDFEPGVYYFRIKTPVGAATHSVPYTIHAYEDFTYTDFIDDCEAATLLLNAPLISDPLYACQWHLDSRYEGNINVESVWAEGITGEGVNVAIVDDGMYYGHEDLRQNVDTLLNYDYTDRGDIYTPYRHHGTHVAGLIAARDNDIGVRGVAPRATIYGYNFLVKPTALNRADAMTRNRDITAISGNSWGPTGGPGLSMVDSFWELAVDSGISDGYDGKGVVYIFAGGNSHLKGDYSNLNELANYYGVIAVCAVNDHDTRSGFSELGPNLWICAPSNDPSDIHRGILTTENSDRYYEEFGGTSSSTPIVVGVAALMRSVNPDLTWRDVKLILAASARKNDARNSGWQDGARKYGTSVESDRYHFNHEYGFGVIDAKAAVDLAKGWRPLPVLEISEVESNILNLSVPDAPAIGPPATVATSLGLNTGVDFVEFVEVNVSFRHNSFRDLKIELESPSGAVSELSTPFDTRTDEDPLMAYVPLNSTFRFGSARHLGEDPNGTWRLMITDHVRTVGGILDSWSLKVYGHESALGAPSLDSVTSGVEALTAAWSAPKQTGNSPITAYDLRYIQTAADKVADSNWTVVKDVWKAETGGALQYVITPLVGGVPYDVQVRAVSREGDGPWSRTLTEKPIQATSGACGTDGAVADSVSSPELVSDCNALLAGYETLTGSAALNWSASRPLSEWAGVTIGGTPRRVTGLNLYARNLSGEIPIELSRLTGLRELILSRNQLTGRVPASLSDLSDLEELSLWGNQLTGSIPASLGSLVNLEELYLSQNRLSGSIPASLGGLSKLRELSLLRNRLTGPLPAELGNLVGLRRLALSSNELTGTLPVWLGGLTDLESLSLWGNEFTGTIPSELGSLSHLEELYLSQNQLTGSIPASLGNLVDLEVFSLWRNQLTGPIPPGIGSLANLQQLLLRENLLSGSIPSSLGDLGDLRRLSLRENRLEGCVPAGLRDVENNDLDDLALPFCDVLLERLTISPGAPLHSFDPYRTDYTAVASAPRVTIDAVGEEDARIIFLDEEQRELTDADTTRDGHQIDLNPGVTVVSIRVTSGDGASTRTYTITIKRTPDAPVIREISSGDGYLRVYWRPPDDASGSDITSYDIRYIWTISDELDSSNWVEVKNVGTVRSGGQIEYTVAGLTGSAFYDVQVRAVNRNGAGPWSETVTQSTAVSPCVTGGAVTEETNTELISDCEALLMARDTLAGSSALNWSADRSISTWEGITLRGVPSRVAWLNIRSDGLNGSIPTELGRLSQLTYLNLRNNALNGRIPAELGDLVNLRFLGLNNNRLSGPIPNLSGMTELEQLYLSNNSFTGGLPAWLGKMKGVRELWLWGNDLSGPIPDLKGMTALVQLKLQNNHLTGGVPSWLGDMDGLVYLYLNNNPLGGTIPSDLGDMSSLRYLWLHTSELTGGIPAELSRLSNLWDLNLHTNRLNGAIPDMRGMSDLRYLRLHGNRLTGGIPSELGDMSSLQRLWLHRNMLSGAIPSSLGNLANLERLWLYQNRLSGEIPAELDELNLTQWRLSGNEFTGCVPEGLSEVTDNDLRELGLEVCS